MSRCTGKCCTVFPLGGRTLAEIQETAKRERSHPEADVPRITDSMAIEDMLIPFYGPLMGSSSDVDRSVFGEGWDQLLREQPTFTCKHFDGKGCTIYERRPRMCRDHGVKTFCNWDGCEYEPALERRRKHDEKVAFSKTIDVPVDRLVPLRKADPDDKALEG